MVPTDCLVLGIQRQGPSSGRGGVGLSGCAGPGQLLQPPGLSLQLGLLAPARSLAPEALSEASFGERLTCTQHQASLSPRGQSGRHALASQLGCWLCEYTC